MKLCLSVTACLVALLGVYVVTTPMMKGNFPFITLRGTDGFTVEQIPDLSGATYLVTGANSGLGFSSVELLAQNGATVIMVCRSEDKCQAAKDAVLALHPAATLEVEVCDQSSLTSVDAMTSRVLEAHPAINGLVLNAGIMHPPFVLTEDGIESQFAVNHLSHFMITRELLPALKAAQPATVAVVTSNAHFASYSEGVLLDEARLNNKNEYSAVMAYGQAKLCNVLFAQELSAQLKDVDVFVNAAHPGGVKTQLLRHWTTQMPSVLESVFEWVVSLLLWDPRDAALTQVYLAVSPDVVSQNIRGRYYVPIARSCSTSSHAQNSTLQRGLWELSDKLLRDRGF